MFYTFVHLFFHLRIWCYDSGLGNPSSHPTGGCRHGKRWAGRFLRVDRSENNITLGLWHSWAGVLKTDGLSVVLTKDGRMTDIISEANIITLFSMWLLFKSVNKTGRLMIAHEAPKTSGFGAEIASTIQVRPSTKILTINIWLMYEWWLGTINRLAIIIKNCQGHKLSKQCKTISSYIECISIIYSVFLGALFPITRGSYSTCLRLGHTIPPYIWTFLYSW